jgi:hypothetical protein
MITKPLRRSKSDCCEKNIPRHAMFLDSDSNKANDTVSILHDKKLARLEKDTVDFPFVRLFGVR